MQTTKMSLANIQGKLSRTGMKNIMAGGDETIGGEGDGDLYKCCIGNECTDCVRSDGITCSAAATRTKC